MNKKKIYVICNSHLDPVWLWDRSSGRSAWLNTMHSVVRIMDEDPDLKFSCSSSALYRWIEECDPALFRRIGELIGEGRWEIVGGWEVQSDVILSRPETLIHQALSGKSYFRDRFNVEVKTAYCVDSFGHAAGLPKILKATGFDNYVYTRSNLTPGVFDWQSEDGSSVTALHIVESYCTGAGEAFLRKVFDRCQATDLADQTMFFGVGDHGGGISRKELAIIRDLQKDHEIVFSTLGEYFQVVRQNPLPVVTGELGPVFRGCYSNCHEVKRKIARAVRKMTSAEKLGVPEKELDEAWKELLFNHFHDILPGTSVERSFRNDIFPGLGSVEHTANKLIDRQLFRHCAVFDTSFMSEGGIFSWNPHPFTHRNIIALDGFADPNRTGKLFNALTDDQGNEYPLQLLPPEAVFGPCGATWAKLTSTVELPPMGEKNLAYTVSETEYPSVGFARQRELLKKLSLELFYDDSHTWGFGLMVFNQKLGTMEPVRVEEFADGPVCSILRAVFRYRSSEVCLDLYDYAGIPEIGVRARLDWHEVKCCLKLAFAHELETPAFFTGSSAASVCRLSAENYDWEACHWVGGKMKKFYPSTEEFSFIEWCAAQDGKGKTAAFFASDLHSCDHSDNALRLTLNRPVLYADHAPFTPDENGNWMDVGRSLREFWIAEYDNCELSHLPRLAVSRLESGESREVTAHAAGDRQPDEFFRLSLPDPQVVLRELRLNAGGFAEATLINHGESTEIELPHLGRIELPAYALRRISWEL